MNIQLGTENIMQPKDLIDKIVDDWQEYDATLNTEGTKVIGRIVRLSSLIGRQVDENLTQHDLIVGEFDVLAALLRADQHQLTPSQLQGLILISSGGLSNRINRLEKSGYIIRLPDMSDGRGVIVELTPKGKTLVEAAAVSHLALENELVAKLSKKDVEELEHLLQKLSISMDQ